MPNTGGLHGLKAATAAGIIAGDPDSKLLVISQVSGEQQTRISQYLEEAAFTVRESDTGALFDICITLCGGGHQASCRIAEAHANIVSICRDGKTLYSRELGNYAPETSASTEKSKHSGRCKTVCEK